MARLTSELARVEVVRAARRASVEPAVEQRAEEVMAGVHLLKIDGDILDRAARLEPRVLRSSTRSTWPRRCPWVTTSERS